MLNENVKIKVLLCDFTTILKLNIQKVSTFYFIFCYTLQFRHEYVLQKFNLLQEKAIIFYGGRTNLYSII